MSTVNFHRTYYLAENYQSIKERANQTLGMHLGYPGLITFNDLEKSVTFSSEKLIPDAPTNRPRVMLLFSNPHPFSVNKGMFLSPNTKGRENLFWPVMKEAGWLTIEDRKPDPKQLAEICLKAEYQGPFEFIFYCYYAFPTNYPEDISKIFGKEFFDQIIEPEAMNDFRTTIRGASVEAVVTFNKEIFNHVSNNRIEHYIARLMEGELIQGQINGIDRNVPIFLTYPTGWRFHGQYMQFRKTSLDAIKKAICSELNVPEL